MSMPQHADHFHYDTNLAWHKSRYGAADDFGVGMLMWGWRSIRRIISGRMEKSITHGTSMAGGLIVKG